MRQIFSQNIMNGGWVSFKSYSLNTQGKINRDGHCRPASFLNSLATEFSLVLIKGMRKAASKE